MKIIDLCPYCFGPHPGKGVIKMTKEGMDCKKCGIVWNCEERCAAQGTVTNGIPFVVKSGMPVQPGTPLPEGSK